MNIPDGVIVRASARDFTATVDAARSALAGAGQTVFAEIDQDAAARSAGLSLRPTTLFVFGNPKAGTALMQAAPLLALDLPFKLLVWQDDGGETQVAYRSAGSLRDAYGAEGVDEAVKRIEAAVEALVRSIVAP